MSSDLTEQEIINVADQFFADVADSRIAAYGNRSEIREVAYRLIKSRHPAVKFGMDKVIAVAQIAVTTGAKPLFGVGELYIWDQGGELNWQLGYKFYERLANQKGGIRWLDHPAPMIEDLREMWGVPPNAPAAAYARGIGSQQLYDLTRLHDGQPINEIIGAHYREGIGVVDASETTTRNGNTNYAPKGKTWQWVANKRARLEVCRALFPATAEIDAASAATADAIHYSAEIDEEATELEPVSMADSAELERALKPKPVSLNIGDKNSLNSLFG